MSFWSWLKREPALVGNLIYASSMGWFSQPMASVLQQQGLMEIVPLALICMSVGYLTAFLLLQFIMVRAYRTMIVLAMAASMGLGVAMQYAAVPSKVLIAVTVTVWTFATAILFKNLFAGFLRGLPDEEGPRREGITRRSVLCIVFSSLTSFILFASLPISLVVWSMGVIVLFVLLLLLLWKFPLQQEDERPSKESAESESPSSEEMTVSKLTIWLVLMATSVGQVLTSCLTIYVPIVLLQEVFGEGGWLPAIGMVVVIQGSSLFGAQVGGSISKRAVGRDAFAILVAMGIMTGTLAGMAFGSPWVMVMGMFVCVTCTQMNDNILQSRLAPKFGAGRLVAAERLISHCSNLLFRSMIGGWVFVSFGAGPLWIMLSALVTVSAVLGAPLIWRVLKE